MRDATQQAKGDPKPLDAIGDRLREERVKAGISQRELARGLGSRPASSPSSRAARFVFEVLER